jgi:hypothetical protein
MPSAFLTVLSVSREPFSAGNLLWLQRNHNIYAGASLPALLAPQ